MKSLARFLSLLLLTSRAVGGCATAGDEDSGIADSEIVDVPHTAVERQAIANCWVYAQAAWAESMHRSATGRDIDLSQSYWSYWHWFDQITTDYYARIVPEGNWALAREIIRKYGLMAERDFIAADTQGEMSTRQGQALDRINESFEKGLLKDFAARRDRAAVRAELDRAWGLSAAQTQMLDEVFGRAVTKTFETSASATGTPIIRAQDFAVSYTTGPGGAVAKANLVDAVGAWRESYYGGDRRGLLSRVQRALHDRQPVIIGWFVDFNALEERAIPLRGSFNLRTLNERGPGAQGVHMSVLEDYQAKLADGTLLQAGVTLDPSRAADRRLLGRAVERDTKIEFLRVKNSWGTSRPGSAFVPRFPGYNDLHLDYLDGPIKQCRKADGALPTTSCTQSKTPLESVVLPPGY